MAHVGTPQKFFAAWTVDELLAAYPAAAAVLETHGVSPLTRCPEAVRGRLALKGVLGRTCKVDDVAATFADLRALLVER